MKILRYADVDMKSLDNAALVDRSTAFGNPFVVGVHGKRGECVKMHREWIRLPQQRWLRVKMKVELRGKDLVCHCAPDACHAEVIMTIANN